MRYIAPRPTVYNGIQMRSRLEAEFAAYLDESGYAWRYEPSAYANKDGQYLPDFVLDDRVFIEVKPTEQMAWIATKRMEIIWSSKSDAVLVCVWKEGDTWRLITGSSGDWNRPECANCVALAVERDDLQDELTQLRAVLEAAEADRDSLDARLVAIESRFAYDGNGRLESVAEIVKAMAVSS